MSGNLGAGTRNLTVNIPTELYVEVHKLAGVSGLRLSGYQRALLEHAVNKKLIVRENQEDKLAFYEAVKAGITPMPKVRLEVVDSNDLAILRALKMAEEPAVYSAKKRKPSA